MKKRRLTVVSPESQLTYNIKVTPHVGYCLSVSIPPLRPRQLIGHHRDKINGIFFFFFLDLEKTLLNL